MVAGLLARLVGLEHVVQLTIDLETVVIRSVVWLVVLPVAVVVVGFAGKFIAGVVAIAMLQAAVVACIALVTFIIDRLTRGVVRPIRILGRVI